jgi:hypothetical protein
MGSESSSPDAHAAPQRWPLRTGTDRNALVFIGGGVTLIALFTLMRGLADTPESVGRAGNVVTGLALLAIVPFIVAVYYAAREGVAELTVEGLRVRVGFLVNTVIPYEAIDLIGGPTERPRRSYGVTPSYRRRELALGVLTRAVEVRLRRHRRMGTPLLFPFLRVQTLWLGVSEPERFIDALRQRIDA